MEEINDKKNQLVVLIGIFSIIAILILFSQNLDEQENKCSNRKKK